MIGGHWGCAEFWQAFAVVSNTLAVM